MLTHAIGIFLFPTLMAFAASSDLFKMTISNWISLLLVGGFCFLAPIVGLSVQDVALHIGAGVLVLLVAFALFAAGWIGGGDAKLAAATALWLGFDQLLEYLLFASVFGGVLTLAIVGFRLTPIPEPLLRQEWIARLHRADSGVPYGIALAAAALVIYPQTRWMVLSG